MDEYVNMIQNSVAQNNAWSAEQAQKQMDFQERMSNTAHQREIADLKASGLNPVLSAKLGGASTPAGSEATGDTSGTSALVELLKMSMETANSAAGAAQAAASSVQDNSAKNVNWSFADIFSEDPEVAENGLKESAESLKNRNPRTPLQKAWNIAMEGLQYIADMGRRSRELGIVPPVGTSARKAYDHYNGIPVEIIKNGKTSGYKYFN